MRNMKTRALIAGLAVILAVLGISSLVVWTNGARDRAFSGTETVTVWQVTKNIPSGAEAESLDGSVEQVSLPKASIPATAVTSLAQVRGKVTTANLVPGEILVTGRFGSLGDAQEIRIPKGLQEVTVELPSARVLGGVLRRGDHVGIITSFGTYPEDQTNFAMNNALVLAVTSLAGGGEGAASGNEPATITGSFQVRLALESLDAAKLVNASEFGKVWLSRQGKDAKVDRQIVDHEDVLK